MSKELTYLDIMEKFKKDVKCDINDMRPSVEMFGVPFVPYSILAWLNNGAKVIYTPPELVDKLEKYVKKNEKPVDIETVLFDVMSELDCEINKCIFTKETQKRKGLEKARDIFYKTLEEGFDYET